LKYCRTQVATGCILCSTKTDPSFRFDGWVLEVSF